MSVNQYKNNPLMINAIDIHYGQVHAVKNMSLRIEHGQIGCLLGPSGCGKSTLLRAIAGFENITGGTVAIGDTVLTSSAKNVPAEQRNIGMVFQDIALFPHLTVEQNIAFGLTGKTNAEKQQRVAHLLSLIGLEGTENRYPNSLSGGQQQRIALARALAPKPKILLMDEPFSGLDATLKETLVPDVRRIINEEQITALVVTHDQLEAFAIADKIALMNNGVLEQFSSSYEIYHEPQTRFVADFIGQGYFMAATVLNDRQINTAMGILELPKPTDKPVESQIDLLLRPDDVLHDDDSGFSGLIVSKYFKGTYFQYQVELSNGQQLMCIASSHHNHAIGQRIGIRLDLDHVVYF